MFKQPAPVATGIQPASTSRDSGLSQPRGVRKSDHEGLINWSENPGPNHVSEFLGMEISSTQTSLCPLASTENGHRRLPNPWE